MMATTLTANFDTRREAEMTVERLVQEQGIERTDIFIATAGDDNSVGEDIAGSDTEGGRPAPDSGVAALNGQITVSVDIEDDSRASAVKAAFAEFDAEQVSEK